MSSNCANLLYALIGSCLIIFSEQSRAENHALLVGVSEYPNLDESQWLKGPVNDVQLVKEVLTGERFGLAEKNIRILSGWPKEVEKRPTKKNIALTYSELAKKVKSGDQVFILMSGHGSQQPANKEDGDIETDGLDEVFLPADTTKWDAEKMTITGAILDDEIRLWTDRIRDKGALVWIIFDSCHSGTMTRGTQHGQRVNRRVDPSLLIPKSVLSGQAGTSRSAIAEESSDLATEVRDNPKKGKLIAMYASQSLEPTFELPLPPPNGPNRGLFTTTVMDIVANAPGALSYRDVAETVDVIYRSNGILQPTPLIEGNGLDLPVLNVGKAPPRRDVVFTGNVSPEYGFEINAGHLSGLASGSVLEVFPPAIANSEKAMGTVRVTKADATVSYVKPEKFEGRPAAKPDEIGAACRASVLYQELGLATLKIAVQQASEDGGFSTINPKKASGAEQKLIDEIVAQSSGLYELVDDQKKADWFLQLGKEDTTTLVPACGLPEDSKPTGFTSKDPEIIIANLGKIARARQLLHIAGSSPRGNLLPVTVEMVRFDPEGPEKGKVIPRGNEGRKLKAGEVIAFRIQNKSNLEVDVTLLHVDDSFAISAVFPESGTIDNNRIPPNSSFDTPRMEVSADRPIKEQVVVFAVRATKVRQDFTSLEQTSLETSRGDAALQSPLGKLLQSRVYGDNTTRGLSRASTGSYATRLLTWTAEPSE